ncbi:MAG TPA: carbon-nitrogen hydrolase family protein [Vampirovibrionales bacterium]
MKNNNIKNSFILSLIQFSAGDNKEENLQKAEKLIRAAQVQKLEKYGKEFEQLICLPEVFNFRSKGFQSNINAAEKIPAGKTYKWAKELAKELGVWLVAGSILEVSETNAQKPFNSCFVLNPQGQIVAKYRKINLFKLQLEDSPELSEPDYRSAGHKSICFETPFCRIGLAICFDLRFPKIFNDLRRQNCELILLPSAFTYKTGKAHWETLCKARAIENQIFFAGINQTSDSNCWGHSMLINPWGEVLESMNDKEEDFRNIKISPEEVQAIREKLPMKL